MIRIQNITIETDHHEIKHNNSRKRRSGYNTLQQYKQTIRIQKKIQQCKQTIRIQSITTVLTDDHDTKHDNSINRRLGYKTYQQYKQTIGI